MIVSDTYASDKISFIITVVSADFLGNFFAGWSVVNVQFNLVAELIVLECEEKDYSPVCHVTYSFVDADSVTSTVGSSIKKIG